MSTNRLGGLGEALGEALGEVRGEVRGEVLALVPRGDPSGLRLKGKPPGPHQKNGHGSLKNPDRALL